MHWVEEAFHFVNQQTANWGDSLVVINSLYPARDYEAHFKFNLPFRLCRMQLRFTPNLTALPNSSGAEIGKISP
jgi:hypothetical protein